MATGHSHDTETAAQAGSERSDVTETRLTADADPGQAAATLRTDPEQPRAQIGLESSGPVAPGARSDLVDQVMERDELEPFDKVHVVMPLGDAESLTQLHKHTENLTARAAGASSSIDADLIDQEQDTHT